MIESENPKMAASNLY